MIRYSPIIDGLDQESLRLVTLSHYQFYSTLASAFIDFVITIFLVAVKQRDISMLGSSFLGKFILFTLLCFLCDDSMTLLVQHVE